MIGCSRLNATEAKTMLRQIAIAAGLLLAAASVQADEAGRIVFVAGDVKLGNKPVAQSQVINEGDEMTTGSDGYVHLRTVDNGVLILRPNSRAKVTAYHVDAQDPANTRIKLELFDGVARSISGDAVKKAPQNFRFNTPVAAIGVRGTDFTVFTDLNSTRISVASGGIVMSGFDGTCTMQGAGPCEGGSSRELFAGQAGNLLQVRSGQPVPQLLRSTTPPPLPPPGANEPGAKGGTTSDAQLIGTDLSLNSKKATSLLSAASANLNNAAAAPAAAAPVVAPPAPTVEPPVAPPVAPVVVPPVVAPPAPIVVVPEPQYQQVVWGRWKALAGQTATTDIATLIGADGRVLAFNSAYVLGRTGGAEWTAPSQGSMAFALKQSEAFIVNPTAGTQSVATLENGRLQIDFAKTSFSTGFDLISAQGERFNLKALGYVSAKGVLLGDMPYGATNMSVSGAVGPSNAAYIFQSTIDSSRQAIGGTSWIKK